MNNVTCLVCRDKRIQEPDGKTFSLKLESSGNVRATKKAGIVQDPPKPFGVLDLRIGDEIQTIKFGPVFVVVDIDPVEGE